MSVKNNYSYTKHSIYWYIWYLAISLFFVLSTWAHFHVPQFQGREYILKLLELVDLARENNIAVWWSGICLFAAGLLALQQADGRGAMPADAAAIVGLLLVGLSADEVCSIHERIGSTRDCLPLGVLGLVMLAYFAVRVMCNPATRAIGLFALAGFALLSTVVLQEYLEHRLHWPSWIRGLRFAIEEGTELAGTFLMLCAVIKSEHGTIRRTLYQVLPDPRRLPAGGLILALGAVIHICVAVFLLLRFDDLTTRGNPAGWYPCVGYFWIGMTLVAICRDSSQSRSGASQTTALSETPQDLAELKGSNLLVFALLLCSIDAVAAICQYVPKLLPSISRIVSRDLLYVTGCGRYVLHMVMLTCVVASLKLFWGRKLALCILTLLAVLGCFVSSPSFQLAWPAILVLGSAYALLSSFHFPSVKTPYTAKD